LVSQRPTAGDLDVRICHCHRAPVAATVTVRVRWLMSKCTNVPRTGHVIMALNPPVREVCSVGLRSVAKPYGGAHARGDGITNGRSEA
jgi:hypothetical protein